MRLAWSWLACAAVARAARHLTPAQRDAFFEDGLVVLGKLLDEAAVAAIEVEYDRFMSGIHAEEMGKDFTDMSKPFGTPFDQWSVVNGMLPHRYHPPLRNNAWERLLPKLREVFPARWSRCHAASLYRRTVSRSIRRITTSSSTSAPARATRCLRCTRTWPIGRRLPHGQRHAHRHADASDRRRKRQRTAAFATCRGARRKKLRPHRPLREGREEGHAVVAEVADDEEMRLAEVPRGGVTLHDEWVVHGSPGNRSPRHRRTYVIASARGPSSTPRGRRLTHSHNDDVNWDVLNPEIAAAAARRNCDCE